MYMFGVFNFVATIVTIIFIPNIFNQNIIEEDEKTLLYNKKEKRKDVSWRDILTNKHSNYAIVACFFGMFSIHCRIG